MSLDALCDAALSGQDAGLMLDMMKSRHYEFVVPKKTNISAATMAARAPQTTTILSMLTKKAVAEEQSKPNKRQRMAKMNSEKMASSDKVASKETLVGAYTLSERQELIQRFIAKRSHRIWTKKVRYGCRMNLAQTRTRVRGRFVSSTKQGSAEPVIVAISTPVVEVAQVL